MHTAIRTKVPFKKKVRGERGHKSSSSKPKVNVGGKIIPSGSTGTTAATSAAIASGAAATTVVMTTASGGINTKLFKRQTLNPSDSPKKGAKKKKRVAAPIVDEDQHKIQATIDATPLKTKNQKKSKSKHKEVIDYSKQNHSNTFGKVQKWLLESPIVAQPAAAEGITSNAEVEHASKVRNIMSKSQSTPERLALRSPKKVQSVSNLNDKVKLQVVYKPPFKFSLKLSKNSAVKTKVLGGGGGVSRNKRKSRTDKVSQETAALAAAMGGRRTGLLVRTTSITDNNSEMPTTMGATATISSAAQQQQSVPQHAANNTGEPNYETLNSKRDVVPVYENVNVSSKDVINSATFRINRSASGSNITKQLNQSMSSPHQFSHSSSSSKARGSSSNINLISATSGGQSSSADLSCGANTQFGSSQNLIRSSTTNLSKTNRNSFDIKRGGQDLSRSSTTNLSKDRRHGSHANLYRQRNAGGGSNGNLQFDEIPPSSRSRKNSNCMKQSQSPDSTASKTSIPRVPSNSNLKIPSLRRGSISNIPRANLKTNSFNQHSRFNGVLSQQQHQHHHAKRNGTADQVSSGRPHTSDCTDGGQFEWPQRYIVEKMSKDEPLPSDLEVMVSDVENLVNDV